MLNLQLPQEPTLTVALDRGFFSLMALTQAVGNISSTRNIWLNIVTSQ
jgi:hypothetical protein